jgi:hypothetical protein
LRVHRIVLAALALALAGASAWWFLAPPPQARAPIAAVSAPPTAMAPERSAALREIAPDEAVLALTPELEPAPTSMQSRVARPMQAGRVVERGSGAGLADVEVALTEFRRTLAVVRSADDGSFVLPREPGPGRAFEVRAPAGWRALGARRRLREHDATAGEVLFELERVHEAPLELLLVETPGGAALDGFDVLVLQQDYHVAELRTDADGRARVAEPRRAGRVQLKLARPDSRADHPGAEFDFDGRSGERRLELSVGPRFLVRLDPPAGYTAADFGGWLSRANGPAFQERGARHRLRGTAPLALRFLRSDLWSAGRAPPWRVWLASDDDRWRGSVLVLEPPPPAGLWIEPALVEHGELSVVARDGAGAGIEAARFDFVPRDGQSPDFYRQRTAERVTTTGMQAGDWLVEFSHPRYEPLQHSVRVEAGRAHAVELTPVALRVGGAVAGVLRSESGRAVEGVVLDLVGLGLSGGPSLKPTLEPGFEDGRWRAHFRFDDVPEGEYELRVRHHARGFAWTPSALSLRAPREGLEFTCRDESPLAWYEFDVRSADPDLPRVRPSYHPRLARRFRERLTGDSVVTRIVDGVCTLGPIVLDPDLRWRVEADGHLPATGRADEFVEVGRRGRWPLLRIELRLERGWAGTLVVLVGDRPLPEALVSGDGVELGRSDAEGRLSVHLPAAPALLEVSADGWRSARFEADQVPQFRADDWDAQPRAEVHLQRP